MNQNRIVKNIIELAKPAIETIKIAAIAFPVTIGTCMAIDALTGDPGFVTSKAVWLATSFTMIGASHSIGKNKGYEEAFSERNKKGAPEQAQKPGNQQEYSVDRQESLRAQHYRPRYARCSTENDNNPSKERAD